MRKSRGQLRLRRGTGGNASKECVSCGRLGKGGREKGEDKKARVEGNLAGIDKGVHIRERRAEGKRLKSEWQERVE